MVYFLAFLQQVHLSAVSILARVVAQPHAYCVNVSGSASFFPSIVIKTQNRYCFYTLQNINLFMIIGHNFAYEYNIFQIWL